MLSAIVCPLTPRELPAALKNLAFWDAEMPPLTGEDQAAAPRPKLVYSFNGAPDESLSGPLLEAFEKHETVKRSFETIEVRFCDLPPEKDVYVRAGEVKDAPFGKKSGPNWMFFETMKALRHESEFVFLMETDCQPLTANWIPRIQQACALHQDAWIIGSHYCGASPLHWSIARHINGNALYHIGDPHFWDFLENQLWPWLSDYIVTTMPNLAYDCGWEAYLNREEMEHADSYEWVRARDILQRFRLFNFVVNIGGAAEQAGEYLWTRADILKRFPGAAMVHGPLAESDEHRRGPLSLGRVILEGSARIDGEELQVDGDPENAVFKRSLWIAGRPLDETCEVAVSLIMECPEDAGLTVALREPSGRVTEYKRKSGAGAGNPQWGKLVLPIEMPVPYLCLTLEFHGPEEAQVRVTKLSCSVSCDGKVLRRTPRVLTD